MVQMIACILLVLVLSIVGPARAAGTDPTPAAVPTITPAQAGQVLDVLNDPINRAAFAATLQAIVKGLPAAPSANRAPVAASTAGLAIPFAPDSVGAKVLVMPIHAEGGNAALRQASVLLAPARQAGFPLIHVQAGSGTCRFTAAAANNTTRRGSPERRRPIITYARCINLMTGAGIHAAPPASDMPRRLDSRGRD